MDGEGKDKEVQIRRLSEDLVSET